MCDGHLWLALSVLTGHFPRVTPSSLTSPAPDGLTPSFPLPSPGPRCQCQAPIMCLRPQLTISGPDVIRAPGQQIFTMLLYLRPWGRCCISGASSHRDNIHWPREPRLWMELSINTTGVQSQAALGGVTTVAVGLICFNLLLDVQYISQTAGGRRTGGRGSQT